MVEVASKGRIYAEGSEATYAVKVGSFSRVAGVAEILGVTQRLGLTDFPEIHVFKFHLAIRLMRSRADSKIREAAEEETRGDMTRFMALHGVDVARARTLELAANALAARAIKLDPNLRDFTANIDYSLVNVWAPEWRDRLAETPAIAE